MKKILSAVCAAVLAASLGVSAFAADYSVAPSYPAPPSVGSSSGSGSSNNYDPTATPARSDTSPEAAVGGSLSNPAELITKEYIEKNAEKGTPVYASYENAVVKANAMASLARTVLGKLNVVTKRYTAVINANTVTEAKDVNLAITMTKSVKYGALFINTVQEGSFGCTVELHIPAKCYTQAKINLSEAHIYYYDETSRTAVDLGEIDFDDDGYIVVSMTDGGRYVIM